jgi:hypothetical protein
MIYIIQKETEYGPCDCYSYEAKEVVCILVHEEEFTPEDLKQEHYNFLHGGGLDKLLRQDPKNVTKKGNIRYTIWDKHFYRYNDIENYLIEMKGFKKLNERIDYFNIDVR